MYEEDGIASEKTVNRDFDSLLNGVDIAPKHRPLLKVYEKALRTKLARENSYLTVCLDENMFAFCAWWVWRNAEGQYIGLTRFEFSDEALEKYKISAYQTEPMTYDSPYTRRVAPFQLS